MAVSYLHRNLHCYLVDHPTIAAFEWSPQRTPGASIPFLVTTILTYLTSTLLAHRGLLPLPTPSPYQLRLFSAAHNLILLVVSITMAVGCSLASFRQMPSPSWLFCFPPSSTPPKGPVFFWAYVFYLSKMYEFVDTFLILLSGGRRITFLHVYHHSVVVLASYEWLAASQSLLPLGLVINAVVHVVMYAYFLSVSLGWRWQARWKRAVTEIQIGQFVLSFAISLVFLWFHFVGGGCEAFPGFLFNVSFNVSLLVLFINFHSNAYAAQGCRNKVKGLTSEIKT